MKTKIIRGRFIKIDIEDMHSKDVKTMKRMLEKRANSYNKQGYIFLSGGIMEMSIDELKKDAETGIKSLGSLGEAWFYRNEKVREVKI